ncbi:MAG TPA: hypothetical protein VGR26_09790, partial [Acidimicrobiales bacterium]|nr:hypothetical protein [Acidimicrobiales bacterium]
HVARPGGGRPYRLDGYDHDAGEIVSRKHTQLAERQQRTAMGYVRELPRKYAPGTPIADVPSTPTALRGKKLAGDMILEVPPQRRPVPHAVLDEAGRLRVTIRETTPPAWQRGAVGAGTATGVETAVTAAEVAR